MENNHTQTQIDEKEDINSRVSTKKGLGALFENIFRKFQTIGFLLFLIPIILVCVFCLAVSLTPGIMLFEWVSPQLAAQSLFVKSFCYGLSFSFITMLLLISFVIQFLI